MLGASSEISLLTYVAMVSMRMSLMPVDAKFRITAVHIHPTKSLACKIQIQYVR